MMRLHSSSSSPVSVISVRTRSSNSNSDDTCTVTRKRPSSMYSSCCRTATTTTATTKGGLIRFFVTITTFLIAYTPRLVVASSGGRAITASIFANNFKRYNSPHKYRPRHYSHDHDQSQRSGRSTTATKASHSRVDLNTINLWNFRSLSSLQLAAQPPSISKPSSASANAVNVRSGRRRRRMSQSSFELESGDILLNEFTNNRGSRSSNSGKSTALIDATEEGEYENSLDDPQYEPTIAEMRTRLGPIGLLVANSVEVGIATAGSYMSGGLFGYIIGGAMGVPFLFKKSSEEQLGQNTLKEIQSRIGNWNSKAFTQGKSWASLSASFSGFHALTRVCRGGVEDRWNSIIGSACAGAYLSRQAGPQAMLQAATTYASFTYVIDIVFGSERKPNTGLNKEFDFTDTPIEERGY